MSAYTVIFAPTIAIGANVLPSVERWIPNPVSLFELSVHDRSISFAETATAVKPVGAAGVDLGVGVAVGVGLGVEVGVGVVVGVGVGVGVGETNPVSAAYSPERPSAESWIPWAMLGTTSHVSIGCCACANTWK